MKWQAGSTLVSQEMVNDMMNGFILSNVGKFSLCLFLLKIGDIRYQSAVQT